MCVKCPNSIWLKLKCVISSKLRKPSLLLLCSGGHENNLSVTFSKNPSASYLKM